MAENGKGNRKDVEENIGRNSIILMGFSWASMKKNVAKMVMERCGNSYHVAIIAYWNQVIILILSPDEAHDDDTTIAISEMSNESRNLSNSTIDSNIHDSFFLGRATRDANRIQGTRNQIKARWKIYILCND